MWKSLTFLYFVLNLWSHPSILCLVSKLFTLDFLVMVKVKPSKVNMKSFIKFKVKLSKKNVNRKHFMLEKSVQKYTTKTDTCNKYMLESDFINIL